ncbi:hypothetical protein D3OALGA1CA_4350 [Olavius algarvensis associated proteobacterium Delta 3]|nr:hypothetical protein D3OALGA1CA_4350 [Olavius algarvensis associated proteobacterium Delta 3]
MHLDCKRLMRVDIMLFSQSALHGEGLHYYNYGTKKVMGRHNLQT